MRLSTFLASVLASVSKLWLTGLLLICDGVTPLELPPLQEEPPELVEPLLLTVDEFEAGLELPPLQELPLDELLEAGFELPPLQELPLEAGLDELDELEAGLDDELLELDPPLHELPPLEPALSGEIASIKQARTSTLFFNCFLTHNVEVTYLYNSYYTDRTN